MYSLAPKLGALLVFAEHRYEGLSFPTIAGVPNCLSYCSSAEALADYANLVTTIKGDLNASASPVIAFGGSYGGMLAAWLRMKYPNIVDGAIAASAPIWSFPPSHPSLDGQASTITRGVSAAGGATDTCRDNLIAAFPLINEAGKTTEGRSLLSDAFRTCQPMASLADVGDLLHTAQKPWAYLAEGNYPFPSTYIPFSLGKGETPLPAWPMRVACSKGLNDNIGIKILGNHSDVNFSVALPGSGTSSSGSVTVDWDTTGTPDGQPLISDSNTTSAKVLWQLVRALSQAVGVWENITGTISCINIHQRRSEDTQSPTERSASVRSAAHQQAEVAAAPAPPAPGTCTAGDKMDSWEPIICNEHWNQVNYILQGVGNDFFWPPNAPRNWTYAREVMHADNGCRAGPNDPRGFPSQNDPLSHWLDEYYGGRNMAAASNIVFSNGLLDPWSSGGVLKNISSSVVAVILPMGAHHLDLMFEDPADPPCAKVARATEEAHIRKWIGEKYAAAESSDS